MKGHGASHILNSSLVFNDVRRSVSQGAIVKVEDSEICFKILQHGVDSQEKEHRTQKVTLLDTSERMVDSPWKSKAYHKLHEQMKLPVTFCLSSSTHCDCP